MKKLINKQLIDQSAYIYRALTSGWRDFREPIL